MLIVPINSGVTQRKTEWICVCPNCQNERVISYAQKWNILKGKSSAICKSCNLELGNTVINTKGLKIGHSIENQQKAIKNRTGIKREKNKNLIKYRQLFAPETLSNVEMRQKQRNAKLGKYGEACNAWRGNSTVTERQLAMQRDVYKFWRKQVFERDNYTCQHCNQRGGKLQADHIIPWSMDIEKRYDIDNGRTLCIKCHRKTDTYGGKVFKCRVKNGT